MNKKKKSVSGGAITAFVEEVIWKGGIVYSCALNKDLSDAVFFRIQNIREFDRCKDSIYFETQPPNYFEIEKDILKSQLVLFIGLPCQISALKIFLGKDYVESIY